ncbi:DUF4193 domain-containing protein [Catenulispora sp. NF23]|uniref:DUF4193 domain-containing protein n=1 Tax=Catenulispora pinistramenti TaxID=2705254 RepID=A0ABS5KRL0_9ACTN|nr:DUF4193 domain-containing protein [Catenulispora pinistramenti]MBS2533558.1 DUF4193 domain-containing protein [Catenulispora pinistramenti]MBS2548690.1 DUF4193 domain-containing protein [Catenulispora pinistramenti]
MATDYDAPRKTDEDLAEDSIEELKATRTKAVVQVAELDESDNESLELPGADLSNEQLTVRVLPPQSDEFTCTRCFLVQHRSLLARHNRREWICKNCV